MPLTRDAVHRYYDYDVSSKISKCILCGNCLKGKHTTNLKCHMSLKHPEEYLLLSNINKENTHQSCTSKEISISEKVKDLCVKLVTTHGRPFAILQDAAFQDIINIAVPSNAKTKNINSNVIKGLIPEKAYQIKCKIGSQVRNKMVSLKLDSATYVDRNFLGINLQYIQNGTIIIRNLAVIEMLERQTGDYLKEKLLEVLDDFKISKSQIYSITTDNGSNFKKMTKLLTEHCSTAAQDDDSQSKDDDNESEEDDNEEQQNFISVAQEESQNVLNVDSIINTMNSESFKPRVMLCAAHILQLAVKDAINENIEVQVVIDTARKAAKILRRPNMKNMLRTSNLRKPIIDCPTRWMSTYQMLVRLISLRHICDDTEVSNIFSSDFWTELQNLIECLKPVNEATLALQREQLTISDFYKEWLNCKTKVEVIRTPFANDMVQAMKAREKNLLNTDLVLENLYLDGRLNVILSEQECEKAQSLLCQTYRQLEGLIVAETAESTSHASASRDTINNPDSTSELELILQQTEAMRRLPERSSLTSFEATLRQLRFEPRLPLNENILAHWANRGVTNELPLIKLANCVLAAPATQVSVERLFSSVKYILNPLRSNISGNLLQDVMLIRANHDLYD